MRRTVALLRVGLVVGVQRQQLADDPAGPARSARRDELAPGGALAPLVAERPPDACPERAARDDLGLGERLLEPVDQAVVGVHAHPELRLSRSASVLNRVSSRSGKSRIGCRSDRRATPATGSVNALRPSTIAAPRRSSSARCADASFAWSTACRCCLSSASTSARDRRHVGGRSRAYARRRAPARRRAARRRGLVRARTGERRAGRGAQRSRPALLTPHPS